MKPIILWMTSRSRSSLVSRIFAEHGLWWGNTPVKQITGYTTYENTNIKNLLRDYKDRHWKTTNCRAVSPEWNTAFLADLAKIVPQYKQWMTKIGVEYFNAFRDLEPYNIFIYRHPYDVAKSLCEKRPGLVFFDALNAAHWRFGYMQEIEAECGGAWIDTDKVVKQDFSDVEKAMKYCGVEFDLEKTRRAIQ